MKKVLVVVVALAGLMMLPATAGAASWKGTVVSKDAARKAVVTVSPKGVARTVRVARVGKFRIGQRVAVRARALADGTFAAKRVRVLGRTGKARVRGVVVRSEKSRVLVSAGGSVFAVRTKGARRLSAARHKGLAPGDRVLVHVRLKHGKLVAKWFKETGYTDLVEIEGIYLSTRDGVLELAVVHRGRVEVKVPADLSLPEVAPGDEIEILARVADDGMFTLVALRHDHRKGHHRGADYGDDEKVWVHGTLSELSGTSVTVQPGEDASAVTCTNPAGVALPGFAVGMEVKLGCKLGEDGELVLYKLWFESDVAAMYAKIKYGRALYEYDEAGHRGEKHLFVAYKARGILESLEPPTISLGEGLAPFSCTEHEDRALGALTYGDEHEFAHEAEVGDKAAMACVLDGDALVLVELETKHQYHEHEHHGDKHDGYEHDDGDKGHEDDDEGLEDEE